MRSEALSIWTVYDHPLDRPDDFVARRFEILRMHVTATNDVLTAPTLEQLRDKLPPGLTLLPREALDDAKIVESWV